MNIKQAAEACGLDADTIRFYERAGVLPPPPRRPNGYRDYTEGHLATLRLVRGLRRLGLSLEEMQRIAHVSHDATCGHLRSALIGELEAVSAETERRILELEHTRQHVGICSAGCGACALGTETCPGMRRAAVSLSSAPRFAIDAGRTKTLFAAC